MKIMLRGERKQDAAIHGGKFCGVAAAMIGGAALGAYSSSQSNDSADERQKQALEAAKGDPRNQAMLYGDGGPNKGLLSQYQSMLGAPQNAGVKAFGQQQDNYLGYAAGQDQNYLRETAYGQMKGNTPAPTMFGAGIERTNPMAAAQINAPAQNGMNLTGSYDKFINGDAGANPYLTKATQGAIDQSTNQFKQMQGDATDNLMRNIMPGIGSNAVLAGQYGGSRQGVAEGNAISDFTKQQAQAMTQFGQNNTNQAVGAQASAFNQGQDRALAATQGLGAQQYGVAGQNAAFQQQAASTNYAGDLGTHQAQAGLDSTAQANNLQAQLGTNGLNAAKVQNGMSNLNGILGGAYTAGQNQDSYALGQAGKVNGLLQPYLGQPGVQTQPMYQGSTAGGLLGGAMAGGGLYNQFNQAGSGSTYTGTASDLFGTPTNSVFGAGGMWGNG
jgi:hypothetical protein